MTLDTYSHLKKQIDDLHRQIQNVPASDDDTVERVVIILEKFNGLLKAFLDADRNGEK